MLGRALPIAVVFLLAIVIKANIIPNEIENAETMEAKRLLKAESETNAELRREIESLRSLQEDKREEEPAVVPEDDKRVAEEDEEPEESIIAALREVLADMSERRMGGRRGGGRSSRRRRSG